MDEAAVVAPDRCRRCGAPFLSTKGTPPESPLTPPSGGVAAAGLPQAERQRWRTSGIPSSPARVEPTNSVAERALRPAVLWRKRILRADSEAGSRFAERLLRVVAPCRQQGRRVLTSLAAAEEAVLGSMPAPHCA